MFHKKEQTAAIYPGNYVPNTPFPEIEPPRHGVVDADNRASPVQVLALAFVVVALAFLLIGWSLVRAVNISSEWATILTIPFFLIVGFIFFLAANGDFLALVEVWLNGRNQKNAITEHADLLEQLQEFHHEERMMELSIQSQQVAIDGRLATLQHQIETIHRNQLTVGTSVGTVSPAQYVEADPLVAEARNLAIKYAESLYKRTTGGEPNPNIVHEDGRLKAETPFSKRGRWPDGVRPEVGKRAAELLFEPDRGQPPVIVTVTNGYSVNLDAYPTRHAIWQKFA